MRKLIGIDFFNEQWVGVSLPLTHVRIKTAIQGNSEGTCGGRQSAVGEEASDLEYVSAMERSTRVSGISG